MDKIVKGVCALSGALISFLTGFPPLIWVLVGAMSLDYLTGLLCGVMGKSPKTETGGLSSRTAFDGLMRKGMILMVVMLAWLLDQAVAQSAGMVQFSAVTGAVTLWFIASEGVSVLENAAAMDLPVPNVILQMLEVLRAAGGEKK